MRPVSPVLPRPQRALLTIAALVLTAAGCGSDPADTASEPARTTEAPNGSSPATQADDAKTNDARADDDQIGEDATTDASPVVNLVFEGLEPLGDSFDYELWTVTEGEATSAGRFDITAEGAVAVAGDGHLAGDLDADTVVVTIEPATSDDPAPADPRLLAGDVNADGSFTLTVDHPAALGVDFAEATGRYLLGTPTNDPDRDELSGVWFLTIPGPEAGLDLPALPAGWVYEGWVVLDGIPVTTGRFTAANEADDFNGYSGPNNGPAFPGEDLIVNPPDGLTFPVDLTGSTIVISVEPAEDNSPAPFALKPLSGDVPQGVGDHQNLDLTTNPVTVSGSGTITAGP